ncbi:MAG: outer membrane protein assembly factor BamD [Salibacteraceae bacterium]|nr:outer membrane protein assembly factor BamD [Salibacteraceae bacterium]
MKNSLFTSLIGFLVLLSSCTEYRSVLKSSDNQKKYDYALELFKDAKYTRAYPLFEQLNIVYRGTEKGERISYYQVMCDFNMKDFILAEHRFTQFYRNYPNSIYSEQCQYLAALCNYKMSPPFSLDQRETLIAMRSFQKFAVDYPESTKIDSVNIFIDELRDKIELKEFKSAILYYKMENYRAATTSLNAFVDRYPNSPFKEEVQFSSLHSAYLLAINSVPNKKIERIEEAIKAYTTFASRFPESKKIKDADEMHADLISKMEIAKK